MTAADKTELLEHGYVIGKEENALYSDVLRILDRIRFFITAHSLFTSSGDEKTAATKEQDRLRMWGLLAGEFAKVCRIYHAHLIENRDYLHNVRLTRRPTYIQEFLTAQADMQDAISKVIENPRNLEPLQTMLQNSPLDEEFADVISRQNQRHRSPDLVAIMTHGKAVYELITEHRYSRTNAILKVGEDTLEGYSTIEHRYNKYLKIKDV